MKDPVKRYLWHALFWFVTRIFMKVEPDIHERANAVRVATNVSDVLEGIKTVEQVYEEASDSESI